MRKLPLTQAGTRSLRQSKVRQDGQSPHELDEIYYVVSGRAWLEVDGQRLEAREGSVLFVERGVEHRFVDIEEDLTALVFFSKELPESE